MWNFSNFSSFKKGLGKKLVYLFKIIIYYVILIFVSTAIACIILKLLTLIFKGGLELIQRFLAGFCFELEKSYNSLPSNWLLTKIFVHFLQCTFFKLDIKQFFCFCLTSLHPRYCFLINFAGLSFTAQAFSHF